MKNKKILLAVCGSVSFYKAYEILSLLKKEEADVRVMLSDGVLEFTNVLSFEALCEHRILSSKTQDWQSGVNHIDYSKNDLIIIAPATANTVNKIAYGVADNVFLQTILASTCPKLLALAANNNMLENFATKRSIEILSNNNYTICDPILKVLACKQKAKGGLQDPKIIVEMAKRILNQDNFFAKKRVVITGGATTEKIDEVRAITNFSTGKMAKALSDAFYYAGSEVRLISSISFDTPYEIYPFKSSIELKEAILKQNLTKDDILIMCAAVSDYKPKIRHEGKIKKTNSNLMLELEPNEDILSNLNLPCKKIGFKLETDPKIAKANAKKMLIKKHLDAVCLNIIGNEISFGSDKTQICFITKDNEIQTSFNSKIEVAKEIVKLVKKL